MLDPGGACWPQFGVAYPDGRLDGDPTTKLTGHPVPAEVQGDLVEVRPRG